MMMLVLFIFLWCFFVLTAGLVLPAHIHELLVLLCCVTGVKCNVFMIFKLF